MIRKWLAVGIILLFVGTCIIPSSGDFTFLKTRKNDSCSLSNGYGSPPGEEWNKTYWIPSMVYSCGNCIQETPDNGYIITGYAGFGYWYNLYLLKVDAQGNELWNRTWGGYGNNSRYNEGFWVEVTSDNGYIITGQKGFDDIDVWLIKTDANGNEEWNQTFGGAGQAYGYCVKQTLDDGFAIIGQDSSGRIWLIRTDKWGNELWNKSYEVGAVGYSLAVTNDGGYIITGTLAGFRVILIKVDENGSLEWERKFGSSQYYNRGRRVQQTSEGGYIIGGTGYGHFWLIKTNETGGEEWNRTFVHASSSYGYSVIQTVDGGYLLGGTNGGFRLVRTNLNGDVVWNNTYIPSQSAKCRCVQQTKDNGYIATGEINPSNAPRCILVKIKPDTMNHPPSVSSIGGPSFGVIDKDYSFCINASDPDGDGLYCKWEWNDGNVTEWLGPYASGEICVSHAWSKKGSYEIQVKIRDDFGHESNWHSTIFLAYEVKIAFLIGKYTNMTVEGDYSTIDAVNLRMIHFRPLHYSHYIAGEKITILTNNTKALITPRFITGIADVLI